MLYGGLFLGLYCYYGKILWDDDVDIFVGLKFKECLWQIIEIEFDWFNFFSV